MKVKVFSIYDSKMEAFNQPFFMNASGAAIRAFSDMVNGDKETNVYKHPEDYTLFELGVYDDLEGKIESYDTPVSLGLGVTFKTEKVDE